MEERILIVDDDITFALMLRTWLSKRGFGVGTASSVAAARTVLEAGGFSLVLSDMRLPDEDGIALLQWMAGAGVAAPVIVMTSYAEIQNAVRCMKLGARDYVAKPVNPDELLKKIREALDVPAAPAAKSASKPAPRAAGSFSEQPLNYIEHGRAAGHDLELAEAMKNPVYQPFAFIFFFEDIHDPDIFRKQFVSINFDTKKTTNAELAGYAAAVYKNADTQYYNDLLKSGYVAKAAAYYAYAKEPSRDDMKKINEGTSVSVDRPMVDAMKRALAVYRKIFTGKASSKLLNGVPLARWTYNRLKQETDKEKLLKTITHKFSVLTPQYVAVLQEARGVKGDRTRTTEIVLGELFDKILKD